MYVVRSKLAYIIPMQSACPCLSLSCSVGNLDVQCATISRDRE